LHRIIGFGSGHQSVHNTHNNPSASSTADIFKWTRDSQYIVYACQAICIAHHVSTSVQYCFVGHSDRVACLTMSPCGAVLASGQAGPHGLVRLWDFASRKCLATFRAAHQQSAHSLRLLEYSQCGRYLAGVASDRQGKTLLVVWDVHASNNDNITSTGRGSNSKVREKSFVKVVATAHTDVHISRLVFVPFDSSRLITCGRDNVRFWRLRNDTLRSCAVNLAPYTMAYQTGEDEPGISAKSATSSTSSSSCLEFSDICVSSRPGNNENLAYACTRTGQIFVLNMARMEVENVRVLEPVITAAAAAVQKKTKKKDKKQAEEQISLSLRLNSLAVSDSFCATGSDDGFVRIWTLDFGQVSVEAEHEAAIGLVRFSPDCFKIATATVNGNLGVLDVKRKEYLTLVRSHTDSIVDIAIDSSCRLIATCSLDSTVRVWNFETGRQLYDFSAPNERPTRLCFLAVPQPQSTNTTESSLFACGFTSGAIRLFNVDETKLLKEIKSPHVIQSKFEITDLTYCQNGKRLLVADSLHYLSMYDVEREYALVRLLPGSVCVPGSLCLSEDTRHAAVVGPTDCLITVFDTLNLNETLRINVNSATTTTTTGDSAAAYRLAYGPAELGQLVCVTVSNRLLKFDSRTGRLISVMQQQQRVHRSRTDCVVVSGDGAFLATTGDQCVKVWDYEMRLDRNSQAFVGHSTPVARLVFAKDSRYLVSVGDSIIVWEFMAYSAARPQAEMPQGRSAALLPPKSRKNKQSERVDDRNEIRVLCETSFEQMRRNRDVHRYHHNGVRQIRWNF
jgi:WD40 repeat protein